MKLVTGNPGKRPIPPEVRLPDQPPPKRPAYLKGKPARLFKEYAGLCPWLGEVDSATLAVFCSLLTEAERDLAEMSPSRIAQLRGLAADLGLTDLAKRRARAHLEAVPEPETDEEDPAAKFFS